MARSLILCVSICTLLISLSCNKEEAYLIVDQYTIEAGKPFRSIYFSDPSNGFISGGIRDKEGYIYKTSDGGISWNLLYTCNWNINEVNFLNDSIGYACGDSLRIIKTIDQGLNWVHVDLSWYPEPEYFLPLKHISFANDTTWYIAGGNNYQFGINIRTQNGGLWWDLEVFQVELNSLWFRDEKYGLLAGYGIVYITPDANNTFYISEFEGDNITSLSFLSNDLGLACGYNGGIYQTKDGGNAWISVRKSNGYVGRRDHFNGISAVQGSGLAVGNAGLLCFSSDNGASWSPVNSDIVEDLLEVNYIDGVFLVSGRDGSFYKLHN